MVTWSELTTHPGKAHSAVCGGLPYLMSLMLKKLYLKSRGEICSAEVCSGRPVSLKVGLRLDFFFFFLLMREFMFSETVGPE